MRKWIRIVPVLAAAALLAAGCGQAETADSLSETSGKTVSTSAVAGMAGSADDGSVIAENIYIGNVAVGGMTRTEAEGAIADYIQEMGQAEVALTAVSGSLTPTAAELGLDADPDETLDTALAYGKSGNLLTRYKINESLKTESVDLSLAISVDEDSVRDYLTEHGSEISQVAVDWGLTRENGEFTITGGDPGVEVDVDGSVPVIEEAFADGWQPGTDIELVVEETEPGGSEEELALVQDVLGTFGTDYSSSSSGRKTNVAQGCSYINGSVIYPGEQFSVSDAMQPRTAENGYALATAYENGTTVDSYGGGVCQVSTTLYNAVIRAELQIDERYGHSMVVSYVDPSADAAIADGSKDFKFTNNTDAPIYIEGTTDGATIRFTIYGHETRPSNRVVTFESETTSTTDPTTEYQATSAHSIGYINKIQSSHTGRTARLWKIVTVDGVEESREVFNNTTYRMSPTIYEVGVASSNSAATAAMKSAIATNNLSKINAAIAEWKDGGTASKADEDTSQTDTSADSSSTDNTDSSGDTSGTTAADNTDNSGASDGSDDETWDDDQ
ncbi:MAG: VanW family protein [Clostridiales bacterium]|nr:VanW family protein [Clostridiales bacterium]